MGKEKGKDNNLTALAGEYAVLSQLALRGFDASLTLGKTKNIDILARNRKTRKQCAIEVKTTNKKPTKNSPLWGKNFYQWPMSKKHETIEDENLFYCFVSIAKDKNKDKEIMRFFIVPSDIVAKYVKEQQEHWKKDKRHNCNTTMREFRLGEDDEESYQIETPLVKDHEDKWEKFLK